MNSRATGLSVRFFRVTIPICMRTFDSSTGKTLIPGCLPGNRSVEAAGKFVTKRPVARRFIRVFTVNGEQSLRVDNQDRGRERLPLRAS